MLQTDAVVPFCADNGEALCHTHAAAGLVGGHLLNTGKLTLETFKGRSDQLSRKRCRKQQSESWLHNIKGCSHRIHSTLLPAANTAPRSARWDVHLGIAMLKLVKELMMMMISALCNWLYNQLLTLLWVCLVSLSKTKRNSYNTDKSWFTPTTTNQGWQLCTTGSHHDVQPQCRTFLTQYMPRLGLYLSSTTLSGMPTHR